MYLGTEIEARVIEMDRNRNNVVLSRRVLLEEGRKNERAEILAKLSKGMRLKGTVSSIVDFGAFVDLGGIDGLVHISELSWNHVNHPSEVVKVGDEVEVEVLDVDLQRERISLGLKQTTEDPWVKLGRELPGGHHRRRQGDEDRAVRRVHRAGPVPSRVWCTSPRWPCATSTPPAQVVKAGDRGEGEGHGDQPRASPHLPVHEGRRGRAWASRSKWTSPSRLRRSRPRRRPRRLTLPPEEAAAPEAAE